MPCVVSEILQNVVAVSVANNMPVYIVGGFTRDILRGILSQKDIDFVVVGSGLDFARKLDVYLKNIGSLVEFPDFDTARYIIAADQDRDGIILEFAGARAEQYDACSRKPNVIAATLTEDLKRRDFTVNALAIAVADYLRLRIPGPKTVIKYLIDPFGGKNDLQAKILRTPLDPDLTFSDDPLRMMRAIRFAGQLEFGLEPKTLQAIFTNRERLKIVSAERVQEELFKMLRVPKPSVCLTLLFQTRLLDLILPEVVHLDGVEEVYGHQHKNNLIHTFKVVDNIAERSENVWLRFAGLLHDIGKVETKKFVTGIGWTFYQHEHLGKKMTFQICRRLRLSKEQTAYLTKLVRWHQQPISLMDEGITDSAVRRLIVNLGNELEDLLILGVSDITTGNPYKLKKRQENYTHLRARILAVLEKDRLRAFQSPVRGEEIMRLCGITSGPVVGRIKKAIEEAILDGVIPNEYEAAKEYFLQIKQKFLSISEFK